MNGLWSLSVDYAVQILQNELRPDREFKTAARGLNKGRSSSTAALCDREKSKTEIELVGLFLSC